MDNIMEPAKYYMLQIVQIPEMYHALDAASRIGYYNVDVAVMLYKSFTPHCEAIPDEYLKEIVADAVLAERMVRNAPSN
jgi:hypothetical protein